jgi:hypothetical protein
MDLSTYDVTPSVQGGCERTAKGVVAVRRRHVSNVKVKGDPSQQLTPIASSGPPGE